MVEKTLTIQEVYYDLSQQAFAAWIRLMVSDEKEIADRKSISKTLCYSLSQTNTILKELRRKGYIKFERYGNPGRRSKLIFRKKTIISGPTRFVRLSNTTYKTNNLTTEKKHITKKTSSSRKIKKINKNIKINKNNKNLTTGIIQLTSKIPDLKDCKKNKKSIKVNKKITIPKNIVKFKKNNESLMAEISYPKYDVLKDENFYKKHKAQRKMKKSSFFQKTDKTPANKSLKKKTFVSNSKNKLSKKITNFSNKNQINSIKKSGACLNFSKNQVFEKRENFDNRYLSSQNFLFIKISTFNNNLKNNTKNNTNNTKSNNNVKNKLDINKLRIKTKQEKNKRKIREKDKLRSNLGLRSNLSQDLNTYQDSQDNMFDWKRLEGDNPIFQFEMTESEREKYIEILEWKKENRKKKKTAEEIKIEKRNDKKRRKLLNKIGDEFAIIYSRYRKLVQEMSGRQRNYKVYKGEIKHAQKAGYWCVLKGISPIDLLKYWHENISSFANANLKVPPLSFLSSPVNVETVVCSAEDLETKEEFSNHSFWDVSKLNPKIRSGLTSAGINVQKYSDRYLLTVQSAAQTVAGDHDVFMADHLREMAEWVAINLYGWKKK